MSVVWSVETLDALLDEHVSPPLFSLEGELLRALVLGVYDADTITISFVWEGRVWKDKCRLVGIDSPEMRSKNPAEKEAAVAARDWVRGRVMGKKVWVRCGGWDKYGRLLGTVYPGSCAEDALGTSLNDHLVSSGFARPYDGGKKAAFLDA